MDISKESAATRALYGIDDMNAGLWPQLPGGAADAGTWRAISFRSGAAPTTAFPGAIGIATKISPKITAHMAAGMDKPAAALIKDLKSRGMLDDTIVYWTTEFGRMPCSQGSKGRDHNPFAFTSWFAGGGFKGGASYGASDEWSYKAVENPIYCYDVHATVLHLLGIDHSKLTYRHNGIDRRLTDVYGNVIPELLA